MRSLDLERRLIVALDWDGEVAEVDDEMKVVGSWAKENMSEKMRGRCASGVSGTTLESGRGPPTELVSLNSPPSAACSCALARYLFNDVPLSTLPFSSFGFFLKPSSIGESGFIEMAAMLVSDMPPNCSATAFLGLSGTGLPRGGVAAGRRAVLSSGMGGCWSRLRLGDG